jgi:hypothetical protein
MRLAQSLFFLVAAALALAVGASYAEDKVGRDKNDPGFNNLDKNKDGYISKSEAKGNPNLYKNFKQADTNGDGNDEAGRVDREEQDRGRVRQGPQQGRPGLDQPREVTGLTRAGAPAGSSARRAS